MSGAGVWSAVADRDVRQILDDLGACEEAREWLGLPGQVGGYARASDAWRECPRGDWLLWLAARAGVDRRLVVRAACDCARLVLHLVPAGEERPRVAIETAEAWCARRASLDEVRRAYAAYAAAAAYAAYAAAAYAAYAAYADDADAAAAAAAAYAAYAAYAYADDAAARAEMHTRCADAVRARIPLDAVRAALLRGQS